ncbi:MAG: carboxypeptidase-like regulatory domain-containing protein [Bacteroidia bacterium]|nr:carboxypeptidase-like regulatory domain-containing protein [Bacteroidia bacterium]
MKRFILRPALLLAVILTVFTIEIHAQDLDAATLLTRSEQYDKAEAILQQLIRKEPANSKNYFFLGENYLLDYFADTISNSLTLATKSAKEIYQKGVEANPNDPLNYIGLAKVAYYLGDDKTATEMRTKAKSFLLPYKTIKKIVPPAKDYAFTLAKIAESYIKDGEVDTAVALPLIREAIKIDNKSRDVYLVAGDIYILVNDGSKAIALYNQAQFADPQSPTANMKIGNIYVKGRALSSAIPYFEEAIELNSNYAPAYRELGQVYWLAQKLDKSKENFNKYLELTAGNIPAKILYVKSLFYAKDYDEVIKNVEEILAVDKSRTYMNRIAGYSSFEKTPPDYNKALSYMEELFRTVAPERILWKDYHYMARILVKKNQNYPKMVDELSGLEQQLEKEKSRYAAASTAEKAKIKVGVNDLTTKVARLKAELINANTEIDRAFGEYAKVLNLKPRDRALLSEIASNYYTFRRYEGAAKTWTKMIDPNNEKIDDYMQIGKAYYNGEKYTTADSLFNVVLMKSPNYIPAYLLIARTYSKMDPDSKLGLAKPKFEKLIYVAQADSAKNEAEIIEASGYLGYYYMMNDNYNKSKDYYNRIISLNPNSKEYKIKGYNGLGSLETRMAGNEKTIEGRLSYLAKAADAYNKILAIDPVNTSAKSTLNYIRDFEALVKKGINPNEIKGVITNVAGQPLSYASVRVKDTAAENLANAKGQYKFEIPEGSEVLLISAKGYKAKEVPITKSRVYNVTLEQ